jgi:hypothetical protein
MIGPFAQFLEEEGIVAQYAMPGTPQQNLCSRKKKSHTYGHGKEHV